MNPARATVVALLTGAAIIIGTIACAAPNLPPPIPPTTSQTSPATPSALTPSSAPTTLPVPTTTAPLVTPRQLTAPTPDPTPTTTLKPTTEPSTTATQPYGQLATVQSVYDGDTITVTLDGEKESVRLLGIDSPELDAPNIGVTGECYGKESGDALRALIDDRDVVLVIDPAQGDAADDYRDLHGRLLRYVEFVGVDVSEYQVHNGNAWVYDEYPVSRTPLYQIAMNHATEAHNGLWGACE